MNRQPANVLVSISSDGKQATAKLADFGISRLLEIEHGAPHLAPGALGDVTAEHRVGTHEPPASVPAPVPSAVSPKPGGVSGFDATLNGQALLDELLHKTDPGLGAAHATSPDSAHRRSRPSDKLTQAGTLVGTLHYMAPELLSGAGHAQPPSDIFSFGLMAYELLAGILPFAEPPLLLVEKQHSLGFRPLDLLCRGLPPALARLFERCLSLDPAVRPTAAELSAALGKNQHLSLA